MKCKGCGKEVPSVEWITGLCPNCLNLKGEKSLPCEKCGEKTKHKRVIDGTAQVWQCVECGYGWLLDYNGDEGVATPLPPIEIEEHNAIVKVFIGKLAYAAKKEGYRIQ